MFNSDLKEKYPFLTQYFEGGINHSTRALAHSILLYGNDIQSQYNIAQEIARLLNCHELQSENCCCVNCNWAREKQHPAILTISKLDNKPSDDESKTVISVKQSQMVKNSLLNTSDYHRVFIFCDAEVKDGAWAPLGLNKINFHEETANSLLKIIEEPPENTTFFFLTRDKNDLIETIISRSQSFFVPSYNVGNTDYSVIEKLFSNYLEFERKDSFDLAQGIFSLSKETDSITILDEIQNYMLALVKSNIGNKQVETKILKDLKAVEQAKRQINVRINPLLVFEDMCLNLTQL